MACDDGHFWTKPAGTFTANGFGLHDVVGNVWEWVEDCWNKGHAAGAPLDGSARESGNCGRRVLSGGSWGLLPRLEPWKVGRLRSDSGVLSIDYGFRVARMLAP